MLIWSSKVRFPLNIVYKNAHSNNSFLNEFSLRLCLEKLVYEIKTLHSPSNKVIICNKIEYLFFFVSNNPRTCHTNCRDRKPSVKFNDYFFPLDCFKKHEAEKNFKSTHSLTRRIRIIHFSFSLQFFWYIRRKSIYINPMIFSMRNYNTLPTYKFHFSDCLKLEHYFGIKNNFKKIISFTDILLYIYIKYVFRLKYFLRRTNFYLK